MLAKHFIEKYNQKHKKKVGGISRAALRCLEAYPFSGNVRELENEMERAVAMADDGERIEVEHLSAKITQHPQAAAGQADTRGTLKEKVENLEKSLLKEMIEVHKGNKTKMAQALGMSRYGLMKKMQRYGL
jgi:transcriptional regulator with PAS, ATPase and Fis domain